jgi:hypothetical protein
MKPSAIILFAALVLMPVALHAAPGARKKNAKRNKAAAEQVALPADHPASAPAAPSLASNPWHTWTSSGGGTIEARYKALENGILIVETKDKRTARFPISSLSVGDRKLAQACKAAKPRPPMAQEIISKAAARLDQSINTALTKSGVPANPPLDDSQFVRRLYLDAIGRIPTEQETRAYLADASPDKRATLINTLLNAPGYTMHMYNWLADTLRVKDDYGRGAKAFLYEDWLKDQIAMNRPWDAMVREMLTADGKLNENGAAGFLLRDAQMPLDGVSNLLTTFLAANVSCAQCHDHPFADWTQKDFYGMASFFGATDGFHEGVYRKIRKLARAEDVPKADKVMMNQLFTANAYNLVDLPKNRLRFPADYQYPDAKPGETVTPELIRWDDTAEINPAYTMRDAKPSQLRNGFAEWLTHPENPRFAAAIANRVWKKVFGLAVQEPVSDLDDPAGASNPELLQHITTYMKQAKFDLREFQRILFNTAAYQRQASQAPDDPQNFRFQGPTLRRMSAEQAWDSIVTLAAGGDADLLLLRRGDEQRQTVVSNDRINAETLESIIASIKAGDAATGKGEGGRKNGGKRNPKSITRYYEGGKPQVRAGLVLARASELPQPAPETHFLRLFGQSDRLVSDSNTTDGSVPQMLQLMNGPVQEIISSRSAALVAASKAATPAEKISSLYLGFLGRQPNAEETTKAVTALDNGLGLGDIAWVLLNSREFLFVQ